MFPIFFFSWTTRAGLPIPRPFPNEVLAMSLFFFFFLFFFPRLAQNSLLPTHETRAILSSDGHQVSANRDGIGKSLGSGPGCMSKTLARYPTMLHPFSLQLWKTLSEPPARRDSSFVHTIRNSIPSSDMIAECVGTRKTRTTVVLSRGNMHWPRG